MYEYFVGLLFQFSDVFFSAEPWTVPWTAKTILVVEYF